MYHNRRELQIELTSIDAKICKMHLQGPKVRVKVLCGSQCSVDMSDYIEMVPAAIYGGNECG
jgi:hypothetical protein